MPVRIVRKYLLIVSLCFLLIILDSRKLLSGPKKLVLSVTTPVEYSVYTLSAAVFEKLSFLLFWYNGYRENVYLKQRNAALSVDASLALKLKEENEILKKQFAKSFDAKKLLPARIVAASRYLLLDKGKKDKVSEGNIVVIDNIYVGKIKKTEDHLSQVELPVDPDAKITAVTSTTRAKGILKGLFGKEMELDEVLQSDTLVVEDGVEAFGEEFPAGLLIGKIARIKKEASAIFQTAEVKSLLDAKKLKLVFIQIQ